jgi:hypothetical protein
VPDVVFPYEWSEYEKRHGSEKIEKVKVDPVNL